MALFHRATITPTKTELITKWAPTRPWGPSTADPIKVIRSYRFDDPDGRVGMETHLVTAGAALLQIPSPNDLDKAAAHAWNPRSGSPHASGQACQETGHVRPGLLGPASRAAMIS
jgi:hypothetical protein